MDLWIRSQNKGALIKVEMLGNIDGTIYSYLGQNQTVLGTYKTDDRAIEVLDEIQSKIKQQFICKYHAMLNSSDAKRIKEGLSSEYNGDFILETPAMDIQPINPHVLIYEMPEK